MEGENVLAIFAITYVIRFSRTGASHFGHGDVDAKAGGDHDLQAGGPKNGCVASVSHPQNGKGAQHAGHAGKVQ